MLEGASLEAEASSSAELSVNSSKPFQHITWLLRPETTSSFYFCFWLVWNLATGLPNSNSRSLLDLEWNQSSRIESFDTNVEGVFVDELQGQGEARNNDKHVNISVALCIF